MTSEVHFSVVIPTYNRAGWVEKTIESVLAQSHKNFEIILVDDGSTDNTEEVVKAIKHDAIHYFKTTNQERGAARNYGVSKSTGNYVVFIDSDDVFYNDCLETAAGYIDDKGLPEVFHVAHEIRNADNSLVESTIRYDTFNGVLIKGNPMACMNVFLRADIAKKFPFNENRTMSGFEDWELWLRLASVYTIPQVKKVCGLMQNHAGRSSNNHVHAQKLIEGVSFLMTTVLSDKSISVYYRNQLHKFKSSCYTYIALHLAINKVYKIRSVKYLFKGLLQNPGFIFEKRFAAIIKHLFL